MQSDIFAQKGIKMKNHDKYNPFLHGTNSSILPFLKRTGFTLMSPTEMLRKHALAPISGEIEGIFGGGHDSLASYSGTSFGRLNDEPFPRGYGVESILSMYAKKDGGFGGTSGTARHTSEDLIRRAFDSINVFLIQLAREAQTDKVSLSEVQLANIRVSIQAGILGYQSLALLGVRIHPDFELYEMAKSHLRVDDLYDIISTHLNFQSIVENARTIILAQTNIEANPELALKILSIPRGPIEAVGIWDKKPRQISLSESERCLFTTTKQEYPTPDIRTRLSPDNAYRTAADQNGYRIHHFLDQALDRSDSNHLPRSVEDLQLFSTEAESRAESLTAKLDIFDRLVEKILRHEATFTPEDMSLISESFPIVVVATDDEKFYCVNSYPREYRSNQPLVIGADIAMLATDTPEHQAGLTNFLKENGINNVKIITFEQLRLSKESGLQPVVDNASVAGSTSTLYGRGTKKATETDSNDEVNAQIDRKGDTP